MPPTRLRAFVLLASLVASLPLLTACGNRYRSSDQPGRQLKFGVEMAQRGLWSEALFRFHQAVRVDPNNPRVQYNLGVAYEAAGEYDKALDHYRNALKLDPNNKDLRANYSRFVEFYQGFKTGNKSAGAASPAPANRPAPPAPPPTRAPAGTPEPRTPGPSATPSPPPMDVPPPPPPL